MHFSTNLFWDVAANELDLDKHKRFIIQRVLEYGTLADWQQIKAGYGIETIGSEMKKVRSLDDMTLSFVCFACDLNKEDFRCYTSRLSNNQHWNF